APHIRPKHGLLGTTFGGNHLACDAGLAVLEVMDEEKLIGHAAATGTYIIDQLRQIPGLERVRGRGLMIGFDPPAHQKGLRRNLLWQHRIFTGEAKPNVVRLLPSLALKKEEADVFLQALKAEMQKTINQ